MNGKEKFEIGYDKCPGKEVEIVDWKGRVVKRTVVVHKGADGYLKVEFDDGIIKECGYNDLGFWEI